MRLLYAPPVNRALRTALRPAAGLIPEAYRFPVTGVIQVEVEPGTTIRLACNPTSYLAKVLFWEGVRGFEYNVVRVFIDLAKRAKRFVDVGANIGYYSLVAAAVNPAIEVVSFEPMPAAFRYLKRNLALNGFEHVKAEEVALSDVEGSATFFVAKNPKFTDVEHHLGGMSSLDAEQAVRAGEAEEVEVKTDTLDHYVQNKLQKNIDLLKLDTEATEHLVLRGAEHVLASHRPVVFCEVLPGKIEKELEEIFKRHDYRMYRAEADRLVPVDGLGHDRSSTNDHVMAHAASAEEIEPYTTARRQP